MDFLKKFDGSGRSPRDVQVQALQWLTNNWDESNVFVMNLPTGAGKSAIARAVQAATGADVVPPTNQLMRQYTDTYPEVNSLRGMHTYTCHETGASCGDMIQLDKCCGNCTYKSSRDGALDNPTFFNPYSLFFFHLTQNVAERDVLIIDEAHNLLEVVKSMSGYSFNSKRFKLPASLSDLSVEYWLAEQAHMLRKLAKGQSDKKAAQYTHEASKIGTLLIGYKDNPENYAVYIKDGRYSRSLVLQPAKPPRAIVKKLLIGKKIIFLSATISPIDTKELLGHSDFLFLDVPSPIHKDHRPVLYAPAPHPMNWKTSPEQVARTITDRVNQYKGQNTIIHLTYAWAEKVAPHLKFDFLRNTPEDKDALISRFKSEGGVFLASGCSEGIDLPDDECRVNIIPILWRLNPADPVIKKRLSMADGQSWYNWQTLRTLIQQAGRSTRGPGDYSVTVVLDPAFPKLMIDTTLPTPQSFKEAVIWRTAVAK